MKAIYTLASFLLLAAQAFAQVTTVDFEDKTLPLNSFYNGADLAGGFSSRGASFNNTFTPAFGVWSGWSYSNVNDSTTAGFTNQYAAIAGTGVGGTGIYGVAFNFSPGDARITLPAGTLPLSVSITNTTYAALSMKNGDSFAKKFGGASGNDPDFFLLTIQGRDAGNNITGTVPFYLADYRFSDNFLDKIVSAWTSVDLSSLPGNTTNLTFDLTSSDVGPFGMNTPSYFALDNLIVGVPEPTTMALLGMVGIGAGIYGWRRCSRRKRNKSSGCTVGRMI